MPENPWRSDTSPTMNDLEDELESIDALMPELSDSADLRSHFARGMAGRRRKAAMTLTVVWGSTIALHLVSWGSWVVLALTTLVGVHVLRLLLTRHQPRSESPSRAERRELPYISLLVSAKNEEAVIESLVRRLSQLDYPRDRYDLWVINDSSSDRTPILLDQLAVDYPQLNVIHRSADAGGGKSGALNQAYPLTQGDIIAVFDADAQVPADLLWHVLPLFDRPEVGAVQVRKAIVQGLDPNHKDYNNFWIQGQTAEMAVDAFVQQQRIALGGIGELRGNGQFVRRVALDRCGGWNEQTITDDLDLTLRLHLDAWDIEGLMCPAVEEEGVTRMTALWHQRNRWAEGGYQRYLDYWRLLVRNRLGTRKSFDLFVFWITQYFLPTASIPDCVMAIARSTSPLFSPLAGVTLTLSVVGMFLGMRQIQQTEALTHPDRDRSSVRSAWSLLFHSLRGTFYMLHWFVVIACTTSRISVRPKRLKWVKTIHQGSEDVWATDPSSEQS